MEGFERQPNRGGASWRRDRSADRSGTRTRPGSELGQVAGDVLLADGPKTACGHTNVRFRLFAPTARSCQAMLLEVKRPRSAQPLESGTGEKPYPYARLGGADKRAIRCFSHSLGMASVSSSNRIAFGCLPSRIASTMSGANSVSRSSRLTKLRVTPSASAVEVPALLQQPLPPMRPRQRANQRLVRPRLGRRPGDRRRWARQSPRGHRAASRSSGCGRWSRTAGTPLAVIQRPLAGNFTPALGINMPEYKIQGNSCYRSQSPLAISGGGRNSPAGAPPDAPGRRSRHR